MMMSSIAAVTANRCRGVALAPTNSQPAWREGRSLDTWYTLPNTSPDAITNGWPLINSGFGTGSGRTGFWSYCGGCIGGANLEEFHTGTNGGHTDYGGNGCMKFNWRADDPNWVETRACTPQGSVNACSTHNDDGTPNSSHTYWNLQWSVSLQRMMRICGGSLWCAGGGVGFAVDAFDPVSGEWAAPGTYGDAPFLTVTPGDGQCTDGAGNVWCDQSGGNLRRWNVASDTWDTFGVSVHEDNCPIVYDSTRNRIIRLSAASGDAVYFDNLSGTPAEHAITWSGAQAAQATNYTSPVYCAEADAIFFMHGSDSDTGATVYRIDASTFEVTTYALAGTPPARGVSGDGANAHFGRFAIIPSLKAVVFMGSRISDDVSFFLYGTL